MTQRTLSSYVRKIKAALAADYDHEVPNASRERRFQGEYSKLIKTICKDRGWELCRPKGHPYCEYNGWIKKTSVHGTQYLYFSTGDFRWEDPFKHILIRLTENEDQSYSHRYGNCYTDIEHFASNVDDLFARF